VEEEHGEADGETQDEQTGIGRFWEEGEVEEFEHVRVGFVLSGDLSEHDHGAGAATSLQFMLEMQETDGLLRRDGLRHGTKG
jgi:hypothetical protein